MIDTGLLNKALEAIELNPERHIQTEWHCETGQCLAGFIGEVSGVEWSPGWDGHVSADIVNPDFGVEGGYQPEEEVLHVADYAEHLLGGDTIENLTEEEYYRLWSEEVRNTQRVHYVRPYEEELDWMQRYDWKPSRGVHFGLFQGDNTRAQLRVALSIIEERQNR